MEILLWRFVVEEKFDGLNHLLVDGVKESVAHVYMVTKQELDDLDILILDGDLERSSTKGILGVEDNGEERNNE